MSANPRHSPGDHGPIDAVITWVDGNDPAHRRKREDAIAAPAGDGGSRPQPIAAGKDTTRFLDNGELAYCLAALRRFAPWLRRIHLVTDNQCPAFLDPAARERYGVSLVDHREVFAGYEWALPCFNSRAIETVLWRIPDLAASFIYLNDDFVLTRPHQPADFFDGERVVLHGSWRSLRIPGAGRLRASAVINKLAKRWLGVTRTMHLLAQMRGAALAGQAGRYFRTPHVPHPMRRDTLAVFYRQNPDALEHNIRFPFRDLSQHLPVALADHLEILAGNADLLPEADAAIISGEYRRLGRMRRVLDAIERGELGTLCLGSVEKLDPALRDELDRVLRSRLGL